mgnify:CR=1 FL=1
MLFQHKAAPELKTQWLISAVKWISAQGKTIKLESELENRVNVARNLINMGIAYGALLDRLKDLKYKFAALKIYKELNAEW